MLNELEFNREFNKMLGKIMTLIEVSGNDALKREVKSCLFDFSDNVKDRVITGERDNDGNKYINMA